MIAESLSMTLSVIAHLVMLYIPVTALSLVLACTVGPLLIYVDKRREARGQITSAAVFDVFPVPFFFCKKLMVFIEWHTKKAPLWLPDLIPILLLLTILDLDVVTMPVQLLLYLCVHRRAVRKVKAARMLEALKEAA